MAAETGLERRDVLRLALLAAADAALGGCGSPVTPAPPLPPPTGLATGIDVHCHAFNARDLPIPGFVLHVFLESDPYADVQFGPLVTFIALLLDSAAQTADQEIAALNGNSQARALAFGPAPPPAGTDAALQLHARAAALAMQSTAPGDRAAAVIKRTHAILGRAPRSLARAPSQNPTGAASGQNGTTLTARRNRAAFLGNLAAMAPGQMAPGLRSAKPGAADIAPAAAPAASGSATDIADAVANGVARHASNQSGVFYFASLLTKPRAELVRDLAALPRPADRGDIALFTPAMIDFSFWLDDRAGAEPHPDPLQPPKDVTLLSQQIAVMSAIAKANLSGTGTAQYGVHPFVSFCPWRQIADEALLPPAAQQFTQVQNAILTGGFVGVKIYPLMGFHPINNAGQNPALYPPVLREIDGFAAKMDAALRGLYTWCARNDVPVMAHCSFSQYQSQHAAVLGAPDGWLDVLSEPDFRNLRLNLGHCGGVWDLAAAKAAQVAGPAGGLWPEKVVAALGKLDAAGKPAYPNLYADLSDYSDVIGCANGLKPVAPAPAGGDASSITALARLTAANPAAAKHIMYGTDFMFLTLYQGTENYLAQMQGCLAPLLGMAPADLMGGNAARFLGLNDPATGTRQRLDAFRGDRFLDRWNGA